MIEYLALAAEVTAVLLIISIAYPSNSSGKSGVSNSAATNHSGSVESLEPIQDSLQTLRLLAFDAASKQFFNHASINSWNLSDTRRQIASSLSDLLPLVIEPNQDAITRLPVVDSLNRFLGSTRSLQVQLGLSIQISIIAVDSWSELVSKHGAITCDRLLREVGNQLNSQLNVHGIVVRFSEHTFAVMVFGVPSRSACELLDETRLSIAGQTIFIGETEIATTVSIGTTEVLSEDFDQDSHLVDGVWERLEELLAAAITSGGNQTRGGTGLAQVQSPIESPVGAKAAIDSPAGSEPTEISTEAQPTSIEATPVAGESAASSDDIAAMFAAQKIKPKATTTTSAAPPEVQNASPDPNPSSDGKASGDDIAALFAAKKSKPKATVTETAPESPEPSNPSPESATDGKASGDDIAALFAAQKSKPKATTPEPVEEAKTSTPAPATDGKASGDDIAALFAAQKAKPKTPPAAPFEEPIIAQPSSESSKIASDPKAAESPDSRVSADDIASLFANTKKPAAAKATEKPAAASQSSAPASEEVAKEVIEEVAEESLIASIDDINALFAAAQKSKGKKVAM
ncbi:MAG: diguanylate cyclase [Planctomycetota bacterium]|nr:diguanylate cyclase [Planctomycetota bacterium]